MLLAFVFASLAALAPQEPTAKAALSDNFVPALNYAERPVEFWLDELKSSQGRSARAVWCLYYHDERSPRVVDALKRWLHADVEVTCAIDTVLNHWAVGFEPISATDFLHAEAKAPQAIFEQPFEDPLDDAAELLLGQVADRDAKIAARAACSLVLRHEYVIPMLRALLKRDDILDRRPIDWKPRETTSERYVLAGAWNWLRYETGSAFNEALAEELAAEQDDGRRLFLLHELYWSVCDRSVALPAVNALLDEPGAIGEAAWRAFQGCVGEQNFGVTWGDSWFHEDFVVAPYDDDRVEWNLVGILAPRLDAAAAKGDVSETLLTRVHLAGLRSVKLRTRCEPALLRLMQRDDALGLEALRMLCHFGSEASAVRERYCAVLASWKDFSANGLDKLPCLRHHDDNSRAAFRSVFERAEGKYALIDRLACTGMTDGYVEPMAQACLESIGGAGYAFLLQKGFCGILPTRADAPKIERVHRDALTIAAKRAHGLDWSNEAHDYASILLGGYPESGAGGYNDYFEWGFVNAIHLKLTTPEFVEAALKVVEEGGTGLDLHVDYAYELLAIAELTPEQKARFYKVSSQPAIASDSSRGVSLDENHEPGARVGKDALERVVDYRRDLYGGGWESLSDILAITHLIPRDEAYLLALLGRGYVLDRTFGLRLVAEHKLDTPAIRASVAELADSCDRNLRELAQTIRSERGWK